MTLKKVSWEIWTRIVTVTMFGEQDSEICGVGQRAHCSLLYISFVRTVIPSCFHASTWLLSF